MTITGECAVKQIIFEWKMVGLSLFDQYEMGTGTLLNQKWGGGRGQVIIFRQGLEEGSKTFFDR